MQLNLQQQVWVPAGHSAYMTRMVYILYRSVTAVPLVAPCPKPAEMNSAACLFLLACLLTGTQCRPGGAPDSACDLVGPNAIAHGADPQDSIAPYVLTGLPRSGSYTPGMSYRGNLLSD